jgi:hypothetical protein
MSQPYPYQQPVVARRKSKAPLIIGIIAAVLLVLCCGAVACSPSLVQPLTRRSITRRRRQPSERWRPSRGGRSQPAGT